MNPLRNWTTQAAEGLPRRRFTVAEVEAMVEAEIMEPDERVELIGGELVPMAPKSFAHENLKIDLFRRLYLVDVEGAGVITHTTLRISEDTYLEPDVVIFTDPPGIVGLSPASVLLVMEIADNSLDFDLGFKARFYSSIGVRELWVIDAVKMTTRVFRSPTAKGFGETRDFSASETIVPIVAPGEFALRLDRLELA